MPSDVCTFCLMRQPKTEVAGYFDSNNPDHFECAFGNDLFPDAGHLCFDIVQETGNNHYE